MLNGVYNNMGENKKNNIYSFLDLKYELVGVKCMKIEIKLTLNNMKNNIKRTIFTIISIMLCTVLIFTTMLLISSIRNGIAKNIETAYNDYHVIIRHLDMDSFYKIKDKEYIDKIYIQEDGDNQLKEIEKSYNYFSTKNNINVYIKYKNVKKACNYSTNIIQTLDLSNDELNDIENRYVFNQKLLTIYGLIDLEITEKNNLPICIARVNYSYILDIVLTVTIFAFSILFIIILYNAFLITINERKKEYAILNCVGATEGQILKMIFIEAVIVGIIGSIIGGLVSLLCTDIILKILNNILSNTGYNFCLMFDAKYMILSIIIIILNIFISAIIPSIKGSTTSVIQNIKNNKQIKHKKRITILEKILTVEGKMAIKNIKRDKNKYRSITILLVVCMTSYIVVSTYINYEKAMADLVNEYDVDAKLSLDSRLNTKYKSILNDYEIRYGNKIEYMEYKMMGLFVLVEPKEALITDNLVTTYANNQKSTQMLVIGLDDKTYNNYINILNANYGDFIIFNNVTELNMTENNLMYTYYSALKTGYDFKLSTIATYYDNEKEMSAEYEIIDNENLNGKFILTDYLIEGYKELKTKFKTPTIFINMDVYNKIEEKFNNYIPKNKNSLKKWIWNDTDVKFIKIKCNNIIEFSNYIEDIARKKNIEFDAEYYSLENQEKIIYINIVQLILMVIILAIIVIGIISTLNIINASLYERKKDFDVLYRLGATKGNINKVLIYECAYMFVKSTIISIILSIPIVYVIVKYIGNIIILNKLLIPFGSICRFFMIILLISLVITVYSTKIIKDE